MPATEGKKYFFLNDLVMRVSGHHLCQVITSVGSTWNPFLWGSHHGGSESEAPTVDITTYYNHSPPVGHPCPVRWKIYKHFGIVPVMIIGKGGWGMAPCWVMQVMLSQVGSGEGLLPPVSGGDFTLCGVVESVPMARLSCAAVLPS